MAGLPKRVVLRKPPIKRPIDQKTSKPIKPDEDPRLIEHPVQDMLKEGEDLLDIPEEAQNLPEVIHTKSNKLILIKRVPEPIKPAIRSQPIQTFDNKVMDRLNIKSKITKDEVTQEKIKKPEIKSTRKSKIKSKVKLTKTAIASLVLAVIMTMWTYTVVNSYLSDKLDGSLASFVYMIAMMIFTVLLYVWFIVERVKGDKKQ